MTQELERGKGSPPFPMNNTAAQVQTEEMEPTLQYAFFTVLVSINHALQAREYWLSYRRYMCFSQRWNFIFIIRTLIPANIPTMPSDNRKGYSQRPVLTMGALQQHNLQQTHCINCHDNRSDPQFDNFKSDIHIVNRSQSPSDHTHRFYHVISWSFKNNANTSSPIETDSSEYHYREPEKLNEDDMEDIGIAGIRMIEADFLGIGAQFDAQYVGAVIWRGIHIKYRLRG